MTLADRVFDAWSAWYAAEVQLYDAIDGWLGPAEPHASRYQDVTTDYYDRSFELLGCDLGLRMPHASLPLIWEAGFHRFWINHTDGSETYYYRGGSVDGYTKASRNAPASTEPVQ